MRVGIVSLIHETNTFVNLPTDLDMFRQDYLLTGHEVYKRLAGGHHEISGFFEGLEHAGIEPVPIFYASTTPSGLITRETCEGLMRLMFENVNLAGRLDGVLAAPHGANVGEGDEFRDLDGHWLTQLRAVVGPEAPIISTIDPHANLTPRMVGACDATIAYRTNPHLDQKERGLEAARIMARTLWGEIRPVQAAAFPAMAINIERQSTQAPPCRELYDLADRLLSRRGVLSNSIVLGFPYADVEEMGSSAVVVTDGDPDLAQDLAEELGEKMLEMREAFVGQFIEIEEALDRALSMRGPVCLLDMGDNVGGGSPGDGTLIAHALHRRGTARGYVCLFDPESAGDAMAAGPGHRVHLRMGGKTDGLHGTPLETAVLVRSLHEGKFREAEVRHGGRSEFDMGPTAVVDTDSGLTISLTSRRVVPVSLGLMTSCGLDPKSFHILVAKGVHAPVAAFQSVCSAMIRVNTPGCTSADMRNFTYAHRRRPLYPFEEVPARLRV